jgi:hypothetical protein
MKNNSTKMILIFLAGLLIGGAIIWLCFCGCAKTRCDHQWALQPPPGMPEPIPLDTIAANTYFHNYLFSPVSVDTVKAFAINLKQYYAMGKILNTDSLVTGFRIYMGATDTTTSSRIMMVVGFGSPDHTETIYSTDAAESGLCPFLCDETSPITKEY